MNTPELDFLKRHPTYAFSAISLFYSLSAELLRKYRHVLLWDNVCENQQINWSTGLVQTFLTHLKDKNGKLNAILHYNPKLPWSIDLIKQFEPLWYWDVLGEQEVVKKSAPIQQAFKNQLEPVNAWLANQPAVTISERPRVVKANTLNEKVNAHYLWAGVYPIAWSLDYLLKHEATIDYEYLGINQAAWTTCFEKLTDSEVELILFNKSLQAQVDFKSTQPISEAENVHTQIPANITFEYFMEGRKKIYI